ncbi:hypothetical protein BaRGS_00020446 [Batillaria attramentaria]|uniref:Uncharacterized protein n=1 Tax=Batillaria attramentaria TaxID=370345 RepID=A0ABD0KMF9_9CAEN
MLVFQMKLVRSFRTLTIYCVLHKLKFSVSSQCCSSKWNTTSSTSMMMKRRVSSAHSSPPLTILPACATFCIYLQYCRLEATCMNYTNDQPIRAPRLVECWNDDSRVGSGLPKTELRQTFSGNLAVPGRGHREARSSDANVRRATKENQ